MGGYQLGRGADRLPLRLPLRHERLEGGLQRRDLSTHPSRLENLSHFYVSTILRKKGCCFFCFLKRGFGFLAPPTATNRETPAHPSPWSLGQGSHPPRPAGSRRVGSPRCGRPSVSPAGGSWQRGVGERGSWRDHRDAAIRMVMGVYMPIHKKGGEHSKWRTIVPQHHF